MMIYNPRNIENSMYKDNPHDRCSLLQKTNENIFGILLKLKFVGSNFMIPLINTSWLVN